MAYITDQNYYTNMGVAPLTRTGEVINTLV